VAAFINLLHPFFLSSFLPYCTWVCILYTLPFNLRSDANPFHTELKTEIRSSCISISYSIFFVNCPVWINIWMEGVPTLRNHLEPRPTYRIRQYNIALPVTTQDCAQHSCAVFFVGCSQINLVRKEGERFAHDMIFTCYYNDLYIWTVYCRSN
jgi:hypothetical protein